MEMNASYSIQYASISDHERLTSFYSSYYTPGHPLLNKNFWQWQYGSNDDAKSIIAETANGEIIGHMGFTKGGGMVWLINILINKTYSKHGLTTAFFDEARKQGPIAVAMANAAGQGLLAKKKWYRYADLQRYVLLSNAKANKNKEEWVKPVSINTTLFSKPHGHYWQQPGINGIQLSDGSTAVMQPAVGGLRLVDAVDISAAANEAWELGFSWIDLVVSWNDPIVPHLNNDGWILNSGLPWYLNPVDFNMRVTFNLFSEEPLPKDFLFHRSYADLGRTGKIA